jgi:hypothetical protein
MRNKFSNDQLNTIVRIGQMIAKDKSLTFKHDLARLFKIEYPESNASYNVLYQNFKRRKSLHVRFIIINLNSRY